MNSNMTTYFDSLDVDLVNVKNLFATILRITDEPFDQSSGEEIKTIALAGINFLQNCEDLAHIARFG